MQLDVLLVERHHLCVLLPQSHSHAHEACNVLLELLGIGFDLQQEVVVGPNAELEERKMALACVGVELGVVGWVEESQTQILRFEAG